MLDSYYHKILYYLYMIGVCCVDVSYPSREVNVDETNQHGSSGRTLLFPQGGKKST